jgi:hypothetical protein
VDTHTANIALGMKIAKAEGLDIGKAEGFSLGKAQGFDQAFYWFGGVALVGLIAVGFISSEQSKKSAAKAINGTRNQNNSQELEEERKARDIAALRVRVYL